MKVIIILVTAILFFNWGLVVRGLNPPDPIIETKYIIIHTVEPVEQEPEPVEEKVPTYKATNEEISLLARLVTAEAKGEPYEGMVAVANVVLNRVDSPVWSDSITEVIHAPRQFQPVSNGSIYNHPTEQALEATLSALEGEQVIPSHVDAFAHKSISFRSWAYHFDTIGNHTFWTSKANSE